MLNLCEETEHSRRRFLTFAALLVLLSVWLRVVALDSDPYRRLSWSTALLSDEGFYLHDARNALKFPGDSADNFHNALIMPTLHEVQVGLFACCGVRVVGMRLLAGGFSLLTLFLFYDTMRRAFGRRVGLIAALFLALDHINFLYNRLGLMDTPATTFLVLAFAAVVRGSERDDGKSRFWWLLCGFAVVLAYTVRGLSLLILPAPFFALVRVRQGFFSAPAVRALLVGLCLGLFLYGFWWLLPHWTELARVNHYYTTHQLVPHSVVGFLRSPVLFLFGRDRGMSTYLVCHSPVTFALALIGLVYWHVEARHLPQSAVERAAMRFLIAWLLAAWLLFAFIAYSPSRYYVLFLPAQFGVAAWTLARFVPVWNRVMGIPAWRVGLGGFFAYHLLPAPLFENGSGVFAAGIGIVGAAMLAMWKLPTFRPGAWEIGARRAGAAPLLVLTLWAGVNGAWCADWLGHLQWTQRDAERWLIAHLPPNSVLLGAMAPGVTMNSDFRAVPVIPGLCSDVNPVERYTPAPRYIVILDGAARETWWDSHYPALVTPANRIAYFPDLVGFPVSVYRVPSLFVYSQQ